MIEDSFPTDEEPGEFHSEKDDSSSASPDTDAKAIALELARLNPAVAAATRAFLEQHAKLLEVQTSHLLEEHKLRLAGLVDQSKEGRLRRCTSSIRIAVQSLWLIVFSILFTVFVATIAQIWTSNNIVVEPVDVSPQLQSLGFTPRVVALDIIDALTSLQQKTRGTKPAMPIVSAWSNKIKLDLPENASYLNDILQSLRGYLSTDIHFSASLTGFDANTIRISVRGDAVRPYSISGKPSEYLSIVTRASEYLYGESQPYQLATYYTHNNRGNDAIAFLPGAIAIAKTDADKAILTNILGNAYLETNKPIDAVRIYRNAVALNPYLWSAWGNLIAAVGDVNGEEEAWRESRELLDKVGKLPPSRRPAPRLLANAYEETFDYWGVLAAEFDEMQYNNGVGAAVEGASSSIADAYGLLHDIDDARKYLAKGDSFDVEMQSEALLIDAYASLDEGYPERSASQMKQYMGMLNSDATLMEIDRNNACFAGLALGLGGKLPDSENAFAVAGNSSRCIAFHGYVLALTGDVAKARQLWNDGVRLAPDLPLVYLYRGIFELSGDQLDDALADFKAATEKAPKFADPLKYWGDVLTKHGDWQGAIRKYELALRYAPKWTAPRTSILMSERHELPEIVIPR